MIVYPDPYNAPLRDVPEAMRERRFVALHQQLRDQGIEIVTGSDTVVVLNLRNIAVANGSIERGREVLYAALEGLRAVRVDLEVGDIAYILGNNFISHAVARGLQSAVPQLVHLLTSIVPDELFDNLEKASAFVFNDRFEDERVQATLNDGARRDLFQHGLVESPHEGYRDGLHWQQPEPPPLPREFQQDVAPWKNPFDNDEGLF